MFDILLIEDSNPDRDFLVLQFAQIPIINKVICHESKKDALDLLNKEHNFGLIISDFFTQDSFIKEHQCFDTLLTEKASEYEIPIVYLSSSNDPRVSAKAFASGAIAFLQKPLDINQLIAVISSLDHIGIELVKVGK